MAFGWMLSFVTNKMRRHDRTETVTVPVPEPTEPVAASDEAGVAEKDSGSSSKASCNQELAITAWQQAAELANDSFVWFQLAEYCGEMGFNHDGAEAARRSIELDKDHQATWRALAFNLMKVAKYRDAIEAAEQALALDGDDVDACRILAISHDQAGHRTESLDAWKTIDSLLALPSRGYAADAQRARERVRVKPWAASAWKQLVKTYGRMGRDRDAVDIAEAALSTDPSLHRALLPLVEAVLNRAPEAAWRLLVKMRAADSENAYYVHLAGVAGAKADKGDEAFELLREATRRAPTEPSYWYGLGRALELAGDNHRDEAMAAYEKALALRPSYGKARTRLEQLSHAGAPDTVNAGPR